jgi:hypothetical protein
MISTGNCIVKWVFGLFDILFYLKLSDIFSGQNTDVEGRIGRQLGFLDDRIESIDEWIKMESLAAFLSFSANSKPNLASAQSLIKNGFLDVEILKVKTEISKFR